MSTFIASSSALTAADMAANNLATFNARVDVKAMIDHRLNSSVALSAAQKQLAATQLVLQQASNAASTAYAVFH